MITKKINTKTVIMVEKCPIYNIGYREEFNYNRCLSCSFIVDEKGVECGWYEYVTNIVRKREETDDDDYGGMPSTNYCNMIKCANCHSEVSFYSGLSHMSRGDNGKCRKCGLYHVFVTYRGKNVVIAVPPKELDIMTKR